MMTKLERIVREKGGTYLYSLKYVRSLDAIRDLRKYNKYYFYLRNDIKIWIMFDFTSI